jgi:1-acyl-sn-glycerol-3-phosphate acyltransferase
MLPPRLVRRLVLAPLVIVMAGALVGLTPAVALLAAAFSLAGRSRPGLTRALRLLSLALVWFLGETAALTALLCLWIASGFGGRLDTEPYRSRHYAVMRWFLSLAYHAAEWACGLRVEVEGQDDDPCQRPVIVFSRHAGPGDSLLLVHYLLTACGRRPRVVMKASLQLDPSLDVVANRLPNAFVQHRQAGGRHFTEQIRRLAAGLDSEGALVLFPEGGNWTPLRWRRAVTRLRRQGQDYLAERAMAMPHVLPPRPGGALAAIGACPSADVIFVAHAGLDKLVSVRDVWRSLSDQQTVRARWWRVPAEQVPRGASREAQVGWLYDWWERIDAWIAAEHAREVGSLTPDTPERFRMTRDLLETV